MNCRTQAAAPQALSLELRRCAIFPGLPNDTRNPTQCPQCALCSGARDKRGRPYAAKIRGFLFPSNLLLASLARFVALHERLPNRAGLTRHR